MKKYLIPATVCAMLAVLIGSASEAADACRSALGLCGRLIVPSLFPFFVLSAFINRTGLSGVIGRFLAAPFCRLYGISPAGASALIIGFIGGYPSGAAYISDMEKFGSIGRCEGERLLAFCNNSGPAFIIGVMGVGVFSSGKVGLLLYLTHILSALLTGLFFRTKTYFAEEQNIQLEQTDTVYALTEAVKSSAAAIINVCAFVVTFGVFCTLLDTRGVFSLICGFLSSSLGWELHFSRALLTGILELGTAAGAMQGLSPTPFNLALAALLLSFGGLSVHFQTLAILSGSKIKGVLHLTGRLISACLSAAIAYAAAYIAA